MLAFERLAFSYFLFFAVVAPFAPVTPGRRIRAGLTAVLCAAAVVAAALMMPTGGRVWLPFLYIAVGYWVPVPLVPSRRGGPFEEWLRSTDEKLRASVGDVPRWLLHLAEAGYLSCFPLVPAAFLVVMTQGGEADVTAFWSAVLSAGYACYITLPWLVSRPPRLLDQLVKAAPSSVTRANVFVLGRVSHQLNTFPSGHVAVSVAAAIRAGSVSTVAGAALGVVAAAVAVGAVAGRYHFIVDVLIGVAVGVIVAWAA